MNNYRAFIDESFSEEEFILGGHIATADNWASLSRQWAELLPKFGTLADGGTYHFKMSEMAMTPDRMERVPIFYKLIEEHVAASISVRLNLPEYRRAQVRAHRLAEQMYWAPLNLNHWANPYFFAFRVLIDEFHILRPNFNSIPADERVDFYFDDKIEKKVILGAWDEYLVRAAPQVKDRFGATPRFENDQVFLPLQAADLWVWWVREWYEEDASFIPDKLRDLDFGTWRGKRRLKIILAMDEDQIFNALKTVCVQSAIDRDDPRPDFLVT
jgi:hypothetical protein